MSESSSIFPEGSPAISRVCVFGATGMLGTALTAALHRSGVTVTAFSRTRYPDRPGFGHWDPSTGAIDLDRMRGCDAIVNLTGANVGEERWTPRRKQLLRDSRLITTELICHAALALDPMPKVIVNASAVGYYGDRGDDAVYEDSPPGHGFLADLCQAWEAATDPAAEAGIRVVCLRFGVVLARDGGALATMLPLFRMGVGGRLGSGRQRMPWIALPDAVGIARFVMRHPALHGPVNAVAPESVTNAQLTETLARVLHRPAFVPVPALALKARFGTELAEQLLLTGANVRPRKLEIAGYRFEYPRLDDALESIFGRGSRPAVA